MIIKRYYLVNRTVVKEEYPGQEQYCQDEVIRIFNNDEEIFNFIKSEIFYNYSGVPMKYNCRELVGLTLDDLQKMKVENIKTRSVLSACYEWLSCNAEQYKKINKNESCKNLIKYGNLFDEIKFNDESRNFFKNNIIDYGNGFGRIFNIPLVKDRFGNWIEWKNQALI